MMSAETADDVFDLMVAAFKARGQSRPEAVRFADAHQNPATWSSIKDEELRDLAERRYRARSKQIDVRDDCVAALPYQRIDVLSPWRPIAKPTAIPRN